MTDSTLPAGLHVLRALQVARAAMPVLVASVTGEGADGRDFHYPSDDDLRVAADKALTDAGLMLVPDEDAMDVAGADATLRWQLVHLVTGDSRPYKLKWGRFDDGPRTSAAPAWASAATWSHATRHLQLKLLNARVISKAEHVRLGIAGESPCLEPPSWWSTGPVASPSPSPSADPTDIAGLLRVLDGVHDILKTNPSWSVAAQAEWGKQRLAITMLLEPVVVKLRRLEHMSPGLADDAQAGAPEPTPPAPVFDRLQLHEPLARWKSRELAARRACDPNAPEPKLGDAWTAATGGPARTPVNAEEFRRLLEFLLVDDERHGGMA